MNSSLQASIIIPTFNRKETLLRCLNSLQNQTIPSNEYEVIVVIDGSSDGTRDSLAAHRYPFSLVVIEQQNRGTAAARNLGAQKAQGGIFLFLDDDILAQPDLLTQHLLFHEMHREAVVVGPTPISPESPDSPIKDLKSKIFASDIARLTKWGFKTIDPYHFLGANTSIPRAIFQKYGGYDETLHSEGDDLDLGLRLRRGGVSFHWNPLAIGYQLFVKSANTYSSTDKTRRALNELTLIRKYPEYRSISLFADLFSGPVWTRSTRKFLANRPALWKFIAMLFRFLRSVFPVRSLAVLAMKAEAASAFWTSFAKSGNHPNQIRPLFDRSISILLYHVVRDDLHPDEVVIGKNKFEKQMQYLRKLGYKVTTLKDWHNWILHGSSLPQKTVILNFDDGFLDCYENAWPILKEYDFPFSVFLVSEKIGTFNTWDGLEPGKLKLMNAAQIQEMQRDGAIFESHSCTHTSFRNLSTSDLAREIGDSRKQLQEKMGLQPRFFAYPYGVFTAEARRQIYDAGYEGACTTMPGKNDLKTDLFMLRRVTISGEDSMLAFWMKLQTGFSFFSWADLKRTARFFLRQKPDY